MSKAGRPFFKVISRSTNLMDSELDALLSSAKQAAIAKHHGIQSSTITSNLDAVKSIVDKIPKLHTIIGSDKNIIENATRTQSANPSLKKLPVKKVKTAKPDTSGKQWFDMGKPEMTPELRRDLQLLNMRHVLDPKRFYKKENAQFKYFQVGTIKEDPTEFFSGRINRRDRKLTLAEEVLSTRNEYFRSKYREIQKTKTSGRRKHLKKLRDMRA